MNKVKSVATSNRMEEKSNEKRWLTDSTEQSYFSTKEKTMYWSEITKKQNKSKRKRNFKQQQQLKRQLTNEWNILIKYW